ncbi:class I SAM-dependent methyltransferase [Thermococcus thioreducens]|uniref:Ubiquinone biosynthesis protein n=1 Tax=Thermococcus thioreducens TaxID=277988 RepID=A0A0Q2MU09_9EURY|nr:class I SAM-dependent methyltransferase [Thermococcus thioreducens]ASJ13337.1 ubiquinone biosynthesis protein [Thermococcus thioreducens]KQH83255.1 ubiquinone biosynthesis protein [Thermococcus thioreducens]SEW22845.1 Ubiquinone/menaquinone biosynthesis C-methylase UbiE [Thermococcus thioreducens]
MSFREKYSRLGERYERIDGPLERFFDPLRRKAAAFVSGKILEVGVGTGLMLPYYPKDIELHAIDAVPEMLRVAEKKAKELGLNASFYVMDAENLEFPDGSFDTVVSTFVFCTVPNPEKAMKEIHRVLRPGGRAVFLEHTKSDCRLINWLFLKPLDILLGWLIEDNTLRETHRLVGEYFKVEHEESHYGGIVRIIVGRKEG